jgi:hypothetical protein
MPYSDEQREFYTKAKAAGWGDEKIKSGITRLGERAAAPPANEDIPKLPTESADSWQPPKNATEGMNPLELFAAGYGSAAPQAGLGIRQFAGRETPELLAEGKEANKAVGDLTDTGWGRAGNILGNIALTAPLMATGALAGLGSGALTLMGLGEGAVLGGTAPVSEKGEGTKNAIISTLASALPIVGGPLARTIVGRSTPALTQAAKTLANAGIKIPLADQAPGILSRTSKAVLSNVPVLGSFYAKHGENSQQKIVDALYNSIGVTSAPTSRKEAKDVASDLGRRLRDVSRGETIDPAPMAQGVANARREFNLLAPENQNRRLGQTIDRLESYLQTPGTKIKGESMRANYVRMNSQMNKTDNPVDKNIMKMLLDASNTATDQALVGTAKEGQRQALSEGFRVANTIAKVKDKGGQLPVRAVVDKLRDAEVQGAVKPSTMAIAHAANEYLPQASAFDAIHPFITRAAGQATSAGLAAASPLIYGGTVLGSALTRGALNTGIPQFLINNPVARDAAIRGLRGYTQSKVGGGD